MGYAQGFKEFTPDKKQYVDELMSLFELTGREEEWNFLKENFVPKWGEMSETEEKYVYEISNLLLKKQYKANPHFYHFLGSISYFKNGKGGGNYDKWRTLIKTLAEGKSKPTFEKYLESVFLLLKDQTLYQSNTITWSVSSPDFTLVNDSVPAIRFGTLTLTGKTKGDFCNLYETSGLYVPVSATWYGTKGKLTWERAKLDAARNYAVFENFKISLSSNMFDIPEAMLTSEFYGTALKGKLREKIMTVQPEKVDHPVFDSFDKMVKVENIIDNVDYYGGFSLRGSRFAGIGTGAEPCKLIFKNNNKPFLEAQALDFIFDTVKVASTLARVLIRLGNDSIVHSGLKLRYDKKADRVDLIRDEASGSSGPLYSSFHELDFFVERITWKNGDSLIEMGSLRGNANNVATFESNNFFTKDRYKALEFPGNQHPLIVLRNFANQNRSKEFTIHEFQEFIGADEAVAKQFIIDLANKGFLYYDYDQELVVLKDKMFEFLAANSRKSDYDVILFDSEVKSSLQPNATLNLNNYDLNIFGVKKIALSDSQAVCFFANKRTPYVTMKKNRNMEFAGVLRAGGFDFYGDSFRFNYDKFKVDLLKVDSVMLYVKRTEKGKSATEKMVYVETQLDTLTGDSVEVYAKRTEIDTTFISERFVPVRTRIENITGELFIDNPTNKSGLDTLNNKEYPILKTNEPSYAYYDKPETYNGVYDKEKFFFKIDPFNLDSLDNFNQNALFFPGTLTSAGIFPDFRDSLCVQDDYSLGFKHKTPPEGLPLYGEKANFNNEIKLSDKGLMGSGDIKYVTSLSSSQRFTFFPDSTTGIAQKMENTLQTASPDVPQASARDFGFKLDPVADELLATTLKAKVAMFKGEAQASGILKLTPAGMSSSGKLEMFDGILSSGTIRYNNSNAFADTASFDLNSVGDKSLAIRTDKVSAQIDFNYRVGTFKALSGDSKINFPKNKYIAFMDTYKWLVDEKKVELSSSSIATTDSSSEGTGSRFISVHPDQDSLSFRVPRAIYDVNEYIIRCKEVKNILVADVLVEPKGGDVNIMPDAVIETLKEATITADYINRFHTIFDATVDIMSAHKYLGRGNYNYEDDQQNKQKITFETITVDSTRHTVAKGNIKEEQNFKLNQFFDYRGGVILRAQDKGLFFNGSTRIMTNCTKIERNWLAFSGQVDPKDVLIPVGSPMKNDLGHLLGAGIVMQVPDSTYLYPTFISGKLNPQDTQITAATGYLWYNREEKTYNIGSKERFEKKSLIGNIVTLDTKTCDITANGSLGFGAPFGRVEATMVGDAKYNYKQDKTDLRGLLAVEFPFDRKMLDQIANKALAYPFLAGVNVASTQFEKALTDWAPKEKEDAMDILNKKGVMPGLPEALKKSIVFADVKFEWDEITGSFVSNGDLGLLSISGSPTTFYVRGKIQVLRSRRGNEMVIYFEFDPDTWYLFKYKMDDNPRMSFYSTDADFMKLFESVKEKDRKISSKKELPSYEWELAPRTAKDSFFERFD